MSPAASIIPDYTITFARLRDLPLLSAVELAAATLLKGQAPEAVLKEITSEQDLRDAQADGRLWVVLSGDRPAGFALVEFIEQDVAHLAEIDVHPDHGRRGLGSRLVAEVCRWAEQHGYLAVTLTTFREIPWNMPFYRRMGFEEIPPDRLSPALRAVLQDEARRGLDATRRVAMRWRAQGKVGITVRPAAPKDADRIAGLFLESAEYHAQLDPERYEMPMTETISACYRERTQRSPEAAEGSIILVAEFNGEIAGFADARIEQSPDAMHRKMIYCHIAEIAVNSPNRNRGIGEQLLRAAEHWGRQQGAEFASLEYHIANTRATSFYQQRMGYQPASVTAIKRL